MRIMLGYWHILLRQQFDSTGGNGVWQLIYNQWCSHRLTIPAMARRPRPATEPQKVRESGGLNQGDTASYAALILASLRGLLGNHALSTIFEGI